MNKKIEKNVDILVGLPCSGKSTFTKKYKENIFIVSRDNIRDDLMKEYNVDYQEMFLIPPKDSEGMVHPKYGKALPSREWELIKEINKDLTARYIEQTIEAKKELKKGTRVVIDLLNLTKKDRLRAKSIFQGVKDVNFTIIKFEFVNNFSLILKQNEKRSKIEKKHIPSWVIEKMKEHYDEIDLKEEGFQQLKEIDGLKGLKVKNKLKNK